MSALDASLPPRCHLATATTSAVEIPRVVVPEGARVFGLRGAPALVSPVRYATFDVALGAMRSMLSTDPTRRLDLAMVQGTDLGSDGELTPSSRIVVEAVRFRASNDKGRSLKQTTVRLTYAPDTGVVREDHVERVAPSTWLKTPTFGAHVRFSRTLPQVLDCIRLHGVRFKAIAEVYLNPAFSDLSGPRWVVTYARSRLFWAAIEEAHVSDRTGESFIREPSNA